jgi:serine/threonine-protein kinase RsbW
MPGSTTTTREFDKGFGSLDGVFAFLDEVLAGTRLDERGHFVLRLAVEELFTNMVKYNSNRHTRVAVRVTTEPDRVRIDLVDPDADDFDPTRLPAVDTARPIQERRPGGLGLHLIRQMADDVEYHYQGREMTVSVTKRLE